MPNMCIVPNCTSNYRSSKERTTSFSFPKDPILKSKWLKNIPRKDYNPGKYAVVCEKHFAPDDIIRVDTVKRDDGTILTCNRDRPKLKEGAVPIIFPKCPKYLTIEPSKKRTNLDEQEERLLDIAINVSKQSYENYLNDNTFNSFENLVNLLKTKMSDYEKQNWLITISETYVLIAQLDVNPVPKIQQALKIDKQLSVTAFHNNNIVRLSCIKNISHLSSFSQLNACLDELKSLLHTQNSNDMLHSLINGMYDTLSYIIQEELISNDKIKKVIFLMEQLHLLIQNKNCYRYSNQTLLWCLKLYMQSSSAYKQIYDHDLINLPHFRNLQKLINQRCMNDIRANSLDYIKVNMKFLKEYEKLVVLQMDEIHIQPTFSYKGGNVTGGSETDVCLKATSVHALLISSLMSSYRDVVRLVPVTTIKAEVLYEVVLQTILSLENLGLKVIALITDNNSINRKTFKLFSNGENLNVSVPNPACPERPLFFILDPVHIIKSIRNNWLNKKDDLVSFTYPDFNNHSEIATASFKILRTLYASESHNLAKCAYKITLKSLYPSNIERQNVSLALRIFDETNVAALRLNDASLQESDFALQQTTSNFIELFIKWWKIFNIKSVNKGIRLNDSWQMPFTSCDDDRLNFLKNFCNWLKIWQNSDNLSGLTTETFTAISLTTNSMIQIIEYLLNSKLLNFKYVLPGKFQSDMLEQRFSQYRQMSGGNYHISFQQILESEKKLRLCSTIKIGGENVDIRKLNDKKIIPELSTIDNNFILDRFGDLMNTEINLIGYDDNSIKACMYIAGYVSFKLKRKLDCTLCIALISTNQIMNIEEDSFYELIIALDRGSLTYPSEFLTQVVSFSLIILNWLTSDLNEANFLKSEVSHKLLLSKLTELKLIKDDICNPNDICICGKRHIDLVRDALCRTSNIFISNYLKIKNQDSREKSKSKTKNVSKNKLKTETKNDKKMSERKIKKFRTN